VTNPHFRPFSFWNPGNNSKKLLEKVEAIEKECPQRCLPIVNLLRAFKPVVEGTMGQDLVDDFEEKIGAYGHEFVNAEQNLLTLDSDIKLPKTWKIHAILFHLPQFLTRVKCGMAQYSKQTMESIHHKMKATFARFCVSEDNSSHGERLLRSVIEFCSTNL
jgi:hypothetical protein